MEIGKYLFFSSSSFLSFSIAFFRSVEAWLGLELRDLGEGEGEDEEVRLRWRRRLRGVGERVLRRRYDGERLRRRRRERERLLLLQHKTEKQIRNCFGERLKKRERTWNGNWNNMGKGFGPFCFSGYGGRNFPGDCTMETSINSFPLERIGLISVQWMKNQRRKKNEP